MIVRKTVFYAVAFVMSLGLGRMVYADGALLLTHTLVGKVPLKSWKELRDERVVKQDLDYSCGAASLATLLNEHYSQSITEKEILEAMDKGDGEASFEDMKKVLSQLGFRAQGFASSWEQLAHLNMPVIVYLKHRKDDHFSVLRGINHQTAWLADPSFGNRTYSKHQFLDMWQTHSQEEEGPNLWGKFLAILPASEKIGTSDAFFTKTPHRQSVRAIEQLSFQHAL